MAISIPSSVFEVYNEALLLFTRPATLVYPAKEKTAQIAHIVHLAQEQKALVFILMAVQYHLNVVCHAHIAMVGDIKK